MAATNIESFICVEKAFFPPFGPLSSEAGGKRKNKKAGGLPVAFLYLSRASPEAADRHDPVDAMVILPVLPVLQILL